MQDADNMGVEKSCQSIDVEDASHEAKQPGKSAEVLSSTEDFASDKISAPDEGQVDGSATDGNMPGNLERELLSGSSFEEKHLQSTQELICEKVHGKHDRVLREGIKQQCVPVESVALDPTHELPLESDEVRSARSWDVSPMFGASSVNFLQLAEIIRGLNDKEYHFLLVSRGAVSDSDPLPSSSILPDHDFAEAFQRFQEELFLATLMKSIFNTQLAEQLELQLQSDNQQCQLIDEVAQLRASHNEIDEKNQHLIEELANCRIELQDVSRKSVELQNQFNTAKAEIEALSARVVELQISFEVSQKESLDQSSELADCRGLISSLKAEKKGMNDNLELVIAEKNRLVEENEFHLHESNKLATEFAEFKSSMEGVKIENFHLMEMISLVTEERNKMKEEIEHLSHEIEKRDGGNIIDAKYVDLKYQFEELKQHCSSLEGSNIELTVQFEAAKQFLGDIQEKKFYLEELCEAMKQEDTHLKAKNIELYEKLGHCQSKVSELYAEICEVKKSSNEMASIFGGQLENLQREMTQRAMHLEQSWNATIAEIFELVEKLNVSVGETLSSIVSSDAPSSLGIRHRVAVYVNAAMEAIFDLRKKLEATCSELEIISSSFKEVNLKCDDLYRRNELAVGVLHKMYDDLRKLVLSHSGYTDEGKIDIQSEALPDLLNYNNYQTIMKCLGDILNEKLKLESVTNEMKSELMQREAELEELKTKCLGLDSVSKLIEDVAGVLNVDYSKVEINKSPLSCLDSLVSSLVLKTREAGIKLHMTEDGCGSEEMELVELKAKVDYLDMLLLENENEILVLKESLHQAGEALTAARSELQEKTKEIEHSEQRVSSLREKLSIAVAKGKGLVVQRDSLKLSLAETSSKLESCLQELQLRDAQLHEIETKLKTYAEAGERVEALESELSYIRHSSNALRESFLLKDSMLQRIEEVLEDLDLPEQFHSRDIIEKIDWLARSVVSSSVPVHDWEQKDSAGAGSYSVGYVAPDSCKDDSQLPPDSGDDSTKDDSQLPLDSGVDSTKDDSQLPPDSGDDSMKNDSQLQQNSMDVQEQQLPLVPLDGDDLRKNFEELYSKYYGLAEQNEMLEQSLMERNSLVQRWEEIVDRIDMPSHLRSMEMEDRIEWIGRALAEANHHVDSLQLKIERYDSFCGLLNADLEHSQTTVSALQADLRTLTVEREHLSVKTEALIHECEKLSAQVRQAELDNETLHNEIASLKDILSDKDSDLEHSQRTVSDFQADLRALTIERDHLSDKTEALIHECEKLSAQVGQAELENGMLHSETASLKDLLSQKDADLEHSQRTVSDLRADLRALTIEREHLSDKTKALMRECEKLSAQVRQAELEDGMLHDEIASLKDILSQKDADLEHFQRTVSDLQADLRALTIEREHLSNKIEALIHECEKQSAQVQQAEHEHGMLHSEIASVKDILSEKDADLEHSQSTVSDLRADLSALTIEREHLSDKTEALVHECEKLSAQVRQSEIENEILHNEIASLKNILSQKEAVVFTTDGKIRKLLDLVGDALPESETENLVSGSENIDCLEELLRRLIENHATLQAIKSTNGVEHDGEADIDRYKKDLEEALSELDHMKEERDRTLEKQISLSTEVETLSKRTEELQQLLNQEEQKSASVREKLNVAVRKGKSLVQHRDSLKLTIEEMSIEIEHLKSEIKNRENTLEEHAQKLKQLSTYPDRLEALESEIINLKNHLLETEHHLQEKESSLELILNKLDEIDVSGEGNKGDPVKRLEWVGKLCSDLHVTAESLEQECRKSKRASELLLAELNEVQERNDAFQEELAKVADELVDLRKERDSVEGARLEALSQLEKLSALHQEEKKSHFSEIAGLKSSMKLLCKEFGEVQHLLANVFLMDLESFQNLEAGIESCMKGNNAANVMDSSIAQKHDAILHRSSDNKKSSLSSDSWSDFDTIDHHKDNTLVENFHLGHWLQELLTEISSLKQRVSMQSSLVQEQDRNLSKLMASVERDMTTQRKSCETMLKTISERDGELAALHANIKYLSEACMNSLVVIENGKAELVGNMVESLDLGMNLKINDNGTSEEHVKTLADRLLLAAKEVASIKTEFLNANLNETKATIASLQRELQEKDVQRDKICSDLVKQIKDAEAAANSYLQDLQSLSIQEHNLKKQVELIEAEKKILEQRVLELQDSQDIAAELVEKIRSQTDLLSAKDQENEALIHALDEEEMQMEELSKKIEELEKVVLHKSQETEKLVSSRDKVMKKLAVTVSKFDELHHLSASLLSEVEKLQSQLQERDAEISFLRQEVTRCTNDVLVASQMSNKRSSDEILEFFMWVDKIVSQEGMHDTHLDIDSNSQIHEYKEILHKKLMSVLSELENLRAVAESKDAMLQVERGKVEELNRKTETLEVSLHEKEVRLNLLEDVEENGKEASTSSEILEIEPVVNEWTAAGTFVAPQVRSLRKGNNDHVAVDVEPESTSRIEDEEDDKVHGFKSLSSSKIVPRFTRPLTDLVDGVWVSCDRTLMRRPILRVGIILYWAIIHALLVHFVV